MPAIAPSLRPAVAALALAAAIAVGALGCEGRPRAALPAPEPLGASTSEAHLGEIDLGRGAPEGDGGAWLGTHGGTSLAELVLQLRAARGSEHLRGLYVRLGMAQLGYARAREIGQGLAALRRKGLPVVCHGDGFDNASLLVVAPGCDQIWLSPAGTVDSVGVAAELVFGKSLLDKLEVDVDFLQIGKYKGAAEPLTRDSASPEAREALRAVLTTLRGSWLEAVAQGRARGPAALGLEDGPHAAAAAVALGLVDRRGTAQEARAEALRRLGVKNRVHYFGPERRDKPGLAELVRILGGTEPAGPAVAVVRAVGPISVEGDELPLGGGEGIAERRLGRLLRKLRDDPEVKAVVLRIDSPGGSALASDLLWTELTALRERKPLVASVGGMAASGGYYLAAAARSIVAEPTSIVGSIGVVGGKLSFARSLEHIGVHVETVAPEGAPAEGRRALYSSALAPWDEATRAKVEAMARSAYDLFVERVAKGRGLPVERVRGSAEGRIFAAADAKKLGLVDELGGLDVALELALKLADLPPTATIEVVDLPPGLLELIGMPSPQDRDEEARRLEQRAQRAARRELLGPLGRAREPAEALLGSLAPLLGAERVVAALPFGVVLR